LKGIKLFTFPLTESLDLLLRAHLAESGDNKVLKRRKTDNQQGAIPIIFSFMNILQRSFAPLLVTLNIRCSYLCRSLNPDSFFKTVAHKSAHVIYNDGHSDRFSYSGARSRKRRDY
jgi:hypothetical protein